MKHICIGDADLDFHFMRYVMRICGLDYKDTDKVFEFQSRYQKALSGVFSFIEDLVTSFPVENYYSTNEEDEMWYERWNPQGTTFINSLSGVDSDDVVKFGVPDLNDGYYIFDSIVEAYILQEICFSLFMTCPNILSVQCALDILKKQLADRDFMSSLDDRLRAVVSNRAALNSMNIVNPNPGNNNKYEFMRQVMKLCNVIDIDPSYVYDFEEQYGDAIYKILSKEGFTINDVLPTYVIDKINQIVNG